MEMDEQGRIIDNSIIGEDVTIKPLVHIKNSIIRNGCLIESFSNIHGAKLGENVKVLGHVFIPAGILIDHDSVIGPGVVFTNQRYPNKKCHGFAKKEPKADREWVTIVGRRVTIGARSIIGSGIKIGDGAFIGMGSVVTKDVPAGAMVYGVPAKTCTDEWGAPIKKEIRDTTPKWQNWDDDNIVGILEKDWNENMQQRRTLHKVLKDLKEKHKLRSLVDAGCGTGISFPFLKDLGYNYSGFDVTRKMIQKCQQKYSNEGDRFGVFDILDLNKTSRVYDVVLNCDVLLHTPSVKPYLDALWRVTKKVLVIKLAYVWDKPTRDDFDGRFYNRKFNLDELLNTLYALTPKPKDVVAVPVEDDEKTSPEFSNAQVFVVWKEEP